jgi:hypothetical protein
VQTRITVALPTFSGQIKTKKTGWRTNTHNRTLFFLLYSQRLNQITQGGWWPLRISTGTANDIGRHIGKVQTQICLGTVEQAFMGANPNFIFIT